MSRRRNSEKNTGNGFLSVIKKMALFLLTSLIIGLIGVIIALIIAFHGPSKQYAKEANKYFMETGTFQFVPTIFQYNSDDTEVTL